MLGVLLLFLMAQMWLREDVEEESETVGKSTPRKITREPIRVIPKDKAC